MPIAISIASAAIAVISLIFAVYSWHQANRPLIAAYVSAVAGGNQGIALNIIVENAGTRPAKNIRLIARRSDVLAALSDPSDIPLDAQRCLLRDIAIPVLIHGCSTSNALGHLGPSAGAWRSGAEIPIRIKYGDLGLRRYTTRVRLVLADDTGFAQSFWDSTTKPRA